MVIHQVIAKGPALHRELRVLPPRCCSPGVSARQRVASLARRVSASLVVIVPLLYCYCCHRLESLQPRNVSYNGIRHVAIEECPQCRDQRTNCSGCRGNARGEVKRMPAYTSPRARKVRWSDIKSRTFSVTSTRPSSRAQRSRSSSDRWRKCACSTLLRSATGRTSYPRFCNCSAIAGE